MSSPENQTDFDIAIIGGGIQGVGIAQATAAAGYKTLLLEKTGWAAGTSSKSSKLIHGGLRYLQTGQFKLVRESLRERELLLKNAPELVKRQWFYIPIYKHSRYRPWKISIGLNLYWLLSGCKASSRFEKVPKSDWSDLDGINTGNLQCVYRYQDAQTDDLLLTKAVAESAKNLGATLLCPAEFQNAERNEQGYRIYFRDNLGRQSASCRILINVAGPWSSAIQNCITPPIPSPAIDLVQGSHLILDTPLSEKCFYLESPRDGRAVFALPWYGKTLLGTTETLHQASPELATTTSAERSYLLGVLKHYFPTYQSKISEEMAGLRVLPRQDSAVFLRSREALTITDNPAQPSYIGIFGGKLTGYRATGEKVLKTIEKNFGLKKTTTKTRTIKLKLPD